MTTKLHLMCGEHRLHGYVNVDKYSFVEGDTSRKGCEAEVLADVFSLPFRSKSIDEIVITHGIEHLPKYDGEALILELVRFLKPGGVLYLEHPNRNTVLFLYCIETLLALLFVNKAKWRESKGIASSMLWGNQWSRLDYQTHRYLWSVYEIAAVAKRHDDMSIRTFRYTASHVPFRDIGIAIGSSKERLSVYRPPIIKRRARSGLVYSILALAVCARNLFR